MIGNWTSSEWLQRVAGSLLHFVWEGAVLAFIAAVLLRLLSHRSAASRYTVSVAALGLMLLAPCATFVFYGETGAAAEQVLQVLRPSSAEAGRVAGTAGAALWTGWIVTLWVAGAAAFWTRLIAGWILSRRLIRSATTAVPAQVLRLLERVRVAMPLRRLVRLRIGERVGSPVVFGWLRPVVLLPASVLTGLNEDQLLAVLAHELAHVRRHDFLVNALQRAVESVLFYHPAVWWLSGRIRAERELCCDDLAVSVCGDRLVYAQALVELERVRTSVPALAVPAASGNLTSRIRRLAGFEETNRDWLPAAAALLLVMVCAVAGAARTAIAAVPATPVAAIASTSPPSSPSSPSLTVREPGPVEGALSAAAAILTAQTTPARGQSAPVITAAREAARKQLSDLHVEYSVETFIKQAAEGDAIVVRTFLAAGMNPNLVAVYDFGGVGYKENELVRQNNPAVTTALIAAAANGQTEIVRLLLAANADVTLKTRPTSTTALSRAASRGYLDAVRLLLGASPGQASQSGNLALLEAARNGHENVARALLDAGVAPNPASSSDASAVYDAACAGHTGVLRALLEKGGDSNAVSNPYSSEPALYCAVSRGNWAAATVLVERGADVNSINSSGGTAIGAVLGTSTIEGRLKMLTLLLDKGAFIDTPTYRNGLTPLLKAIASLSSARSGVRGGSPDREQTEVVKLLISRGANINLKGGQMPTSPLYDAAKNGMTDIVQVLLGKGADVTVSANGGSLLSAAARYPETVEILRKAGAQ